MDSIEDREMGSDAGEARKSVGKWIDEIQLSERELQPWWKSGDVIIRRFRNEERNGRGGKTANVSPLRRFAILWSNVQTLQPAIFAKNPVPIVSRRYRDEDPVGKVASEVLERSLSFSLDQYDFDSRLQHVVQDYLLPGRGHVWVRYVPTMRQVNPVQDVDLGEGVEDQPLSEEVAYEEVQCDHVAWKDWLTNPAREWSEVRWVARRVYMTREELVERFGEIGRKVPLSTTATGADDAEDAQREANKTGEVYEVWDKPTKRAYWLCKTFTESLLDEREDPLGLSGFFPCPPPLNATTAPDSTIPVADYVQYQDQAEELDELTARIAKLQDALRMVGFYAGEENIALQRVFAPGNENKLIPVDSFDLFKEKGGVRGIIEWVPVDQVIQTLRGCYEARSMVLQDIYQITGLSDIIRGDSNPNETATAQRIKGQWGGLRVRDRQKAVQKFARDTIRIKAEIIAGQFSIDTLKAMTNVKLLTNEEKQGVQMAMMQAQITGQPPQIPPEVMELMEQPSWDDVKALLADNTLRSFRIDVETDSTIEPDETAAKQAYNEFVTATVGLMQAAAGIIPAAPNTAPLFAEFMKQGARIYDAPRSLEDVIEKVFGGLEQMPPAQPSGPPQPDPAQMEAEAMKGQVEMQKLQVEQQRTQQEGQLGMMDAQLRAQELQLKGQALARDPTPQGVA
jgi:hypothetical protein